MSKNRVAVLKVVSKQLSVTAAAVEYGMSRQHLQRLLARYREGGLDAVEPRSRRPRSSPHATAEAVRERVIALRLELTAAGLDAGPVTMPDNAKSPAKGRALQRCNPCRDSDDTYVATHHTVPAVGLEPTRPFGQSILSAPRLPFRHAGRHRLSKIPQTGIRTARRRPGHNTRPHARRDRVFRAVPHRSYTLEP